MSSKPSRAHATKNTAPTTPTRGGLTIIADCAERLAVHLERLHERHSADFSTIYAFDRHYNPDAPDLAADVQGWPRSVAEALATIQAVCGEAEGKQAHREAVAVERVAELWGAADAIRAAVDGRLTAEVWLKPGEIHRRFLGASPSTVARMRGRIQHKHLGNTYLYLESDCEKVFALRRK